MAKPFLIHFHNAGQSNYGYLSFAEGENQIPFEIKRVYWIYAIPDDLLRGGHAHKRGEQVLISMKGEIEIELENKDGEKYVFTLSDPSEGLYVPGELWRNVKMEKDSILLSLASTFYDEDNYIRDYKTFRNS